MHDLVTMMEDFNAFCRAYGEVQESEQGYTALVRQTLDLPAVILLV